MFDYGIAPTTDSLPLSLAARVAKMSEENLLEEFSKRGLSDCLDLDGVKHFEVSDLDRVLSDLAKAKPKQLKSRPARKAGFSKSKSSKVRWPGRVRLF